jgi:hypothetical protein
MPDITAYSKAFRDMEGLIGACNENGNLIPGHEPLKAELQAALEEARTLKVQQESLAGNRLAATDRFLDKVDEGRVKRQKLRAFIISVLGPQSVHLKLFGIAPQPVPNPNSRRRRKKKSETPETPTPETPTQTPAGPQTSEGQAAKAEA